MPAKPALISLRAVGSLGAAACLLLGRAASPVHAAPAKAPLPTVLLYPASAGDVAALVDLRTRLRLDGRVQVLTYDPESAAIQRASSETNHPDWLLHVPSNDSGRMTLARALGLPHRVLKLPGRPLLTQHAVLLLALNQEFPTRKARDVFGFNPTIPLTEGIEHAAVWLRDRSNA